jgi:hypothetical protein
MKFEEAFREINGRDPQVDEVKHALAIQRVVRESDMDPTMLFFLADANATAQRRRITGEIKSAIDKGVERLTAAIPAQGELASAMRDVQAIDRTFNRLNAVCETVTRWALLAAALAVVAALSVAVAGWRAGYDAGWTDGRNAGYLPVGRQVCEGIENVRHDLRLHRADTQAIDRERVKRGCE